MKQLQWPPFTFVIKALSLCFVMFAGVEWFKANYRIGLDFQHEKCLPGYSLFLVELTKTNLDLQKNEVYAFRSQGLSPIFEDGTLMAKRFMAGPGDQVAVTVETRMVNGEKTYVGFADILVNDEVIRQGLVYAERLNKDPEQFAGATILGQDEYWFLGDSPWSFDSRYWGPVRKSQVVGRAIPIL